MSPRSLMRRRPSAPMVVSFLALFVALGGASWAALRVPPNSVGTAQLQNFSVSNSKLRPNAVGARKIIPGAVGAAQVNSSQVQLRVSGPCSTGAIQSIALSGNVTCIPALPNEYGNTPSPVMLGSGSTQVATETLPGSHAGLSYLVLGSVRVSALENAVGPQSAGVTCSMSPGSSTGTQGDYTAELGYASSSAASGTISIALPVVVSGSPETVGISCADSASPATPAPSVTVIAAINAIQTASNN